jgi:hypothetical protein
LKSGREQVEIIALYEELGSYQAVAALVGCDHKTVKRYVELAGELGQLAPTPKSGRSRRSHPRSWRPAAELRHSRRRRSIPAILSPPRSASRNRSSSRRAAKRAMCSV